MNVSAQIQFPSHLLRMMQGIFTAVSFSLLLAGTNAITPLIPIYKNELQFSPLLMSMTFVCYVLVLIVALLSLSRPTFVRWSAWFICLALVIMAISDGLMSLATEQAIMIGRAFAGLAGGLGTGSAAALVVSAMGVKGRSISATGNLVGAVIGTLFSQLCVNLLAAQAMQTVFYIHATACIFMFLMMFYILNCNKKTNDALLRVSRGPTQKMNFPIRSFLSPFAVGCISWAALASSIVFLPSFYDNLGMLNASRYTVIVMVSLCTLGQLGSPWLTRVTPSSSGMGSMLLGMALISASGFFLSTLMAVVGCALLGFGSGIAYRLALVVMTRNIPPSEHGARSSFYAAVTYCSSATFILSAGLLGNYIGLQHMIYCFYGFIFVLSLLCSIRAPQLKESIELKIAPMCE